MDEYISREDVLSYIYATHSSGGFKREDDYFWLHDRVINAASADVHPVKHGKDVMKVLQQVSECAWNVNFTVKIQVCVYSQICQYSGSTRKLKKH